MLKIARVSSDDSILSFLQNNGFYCSALLCSIEIEDLDNANPVTLFLNSEIRLLQDFIKANVVLRTLPFQNDSISLRHSLTMIPLFRTVLEGYFKVDYVYCILQMGESVKWGVINERFSRIVDICKKQYSEFIDKGAPYLGLDFKDLDSKGKQMNIQDMVKNTHRDSAHEREESMDNIAYSLYRACCFYTHGNMNAGLIKAAEIPEFAYIDLNFMMEAISNSYLKYFSSLVKRGSPSLINIINEVHKAEEESMFLNS